MIAFVVFALAFQLGISAAKAECPKLPPMQLENANNPGCITGSSSVNETCGFSCPVGYGLEADHDRVYFEFVCQPNGTWSGEIHKCVDIWPPDVYCPNDITIVAKEGSPAEVVSWKLYANDTSLLVDPNAKVTVQSSPTPPYNFTIGRHLVNIAATDKAGNQRSCQFNVIIRDEELPSCSFCPSDIVKVAHKLYERVSWDRPICSDNSHWPPKISANYRNSQIFSVPGKYQVTYTVEDFAFPKPNIYTGCSFTITLKMSKCKMYDPPKNGALVCLHRDADGFPWLCQVVCNDGTDFNFNPSLLYICPYSGHWVDTSVRQVKLPWPNCSTKASHSWIQMKYRQYYFYSGDANDPRVQEAIKVKSYSLMTTSGLIPPPFCLMNPKCTKDRISVSPGVIV